MNRLDWLSSRASRFQSPSSVHWLGTFIWSAIAMIALWIYHLPNEVTPEQLQSPITWSEAEQLAASQALWRQSLIEEQQRESKLAIDRQQACQWYAPAIKWHLVSQSIQELCSQTHLKLIALEPRDAFQGKRIAIQAAECRIEGSYIHLCQFLHDLNQLEHPIWASGIEIVSNPKQPVLAIVVTLRIPFAGERTIASELLETPGVKTEPKAELTASKERSNGQS